MDISALYTVQAHETGAEMRVDGPDGSPTDVYITLAGMDSKAWRNASREHQRQVLASAMGGEEKEDDTAILLSRVSLSWRGIEEGGKPKEFTQEAAAELYRNAPYIADQVDRFVGDRANFTSG